MQNNLLNTNSNKIWKVWKSNSKSTPCSDTCVNDLKDDLSIANYLADSFKSACTPNNINKEMSFKEKYFCRKNSSASFINRPLFSV